MAGPWNAATNNSALALGVGMKGNMCMTPSFFGQAGDYADDVERALALIDRDADAGRDQAWEIARPGRGPATSAGIGNQSLRASQAIGQARLARQGPAPHPFRQRNAGRYA
jgi:hypothetical protein